MKSKKNSLKESSIRLKKGVIVPFYLVKWKNFPSSCNSWESSDNLKNLYSYYFLKAD